MSVWLIDADSIEVSIDSSSFNVIYKNDIVKEFLENNKLLGVAAPKGLGKTFLLKHKRIKIQKSGGVCLPENKMLDILDSVNVNASIFRYLREKQNWLEIWKLSISLSLIKHYRNDYNFNMELLQEIDEKIYNWVTSDKMPISTCDFFNRLLTLDRSELNNIIINTPNIFHEIKNIRQSTNIFIDKTDQAFSHHIERASESSLSAMGPREHTFWHFAQFYLAVASYSTYIENPHIKVYYGIRSEALHDADGLSDLLNQLGSYIATIEYDKNDLKNMFELYIRNESNMYLAKPELREKNPTKAFTGFDKIQHGYVMDNDHYAEESFFNYMYRHTLKRPRDIMRICNAIVISGIKNIKIPKLKHIINKESEFIYKRYIEESEQITLFLPSMIQELFASLVNTNVFSSEYIFHICRYINNKIFCNENCIECEATHAFSSFFNIGLLGYLKNNNENNTLPKIYFNNPGDAKINLDIHHLPSSKLYFLHPMFTNSLQTYRMYLNKDFDICKECIVGDKLKLNYIQVDNILEKEPSILNKIEERKIFISSTCFDLSDERKSVHDMFNQRGFNVIRSDINSFPSGNNEVHSHDHCINQMLKCNTVVFIQGLRYGGEYIGDQFKKEAEELAHISPMLVKPSISLMEYYIAKKNKIPVYSFIDEKAYTERPIYKTNKMNYKPFYADDNRIFHIIDFITKQEKGNWFITYKDLEDLKEIVDIQFRNRNNQFY